MLATSVIAVAVPAAGRVKTRLSSVSAPACSSAAMTAHRSSCRFGSVRTRTEFSVSRRPTRLAAKGGKPAPAEEFDPEMIELELVEKMEKAVDAVKRNFATVRTGRANSGMLDRIMVWQLQGDVLIDLSTEAGSVDYYGAMTPLKSMSNVSTPDAQTLMIQPFDKGAVKDIERAIQMSDLGINPSNDGNLIRLNIPPLTQDRRKEMSKQVGKLAEDGKIALRNVRRDSLKLVEKLEKDKTISEDECTKLKDKVQKLTDGFVKQVEEVETSKTKELMQV